jgi:hypothetical protein
LTRSPKGDGAAGGAITSTGDIGVKGDMTAAGAASAVSLDVDGNLTVNVGTTSASGGNIAVTVLKNLTVAADATLTASSGSVLVGGNVTLSPKGTGTKGGIITASSGMLGFRGTLNVSGTSETKAENGTLPATIAVESFTNLSTIHAAAKKTATYAGISVMGFENNLVVSTAVTISGGIPVALNDIAITSAGSITISGTDSVATAVKLTGDILVAGKLQVSKYATANIAGLNSNVTIINGGEVIVTDGATSTPASVSIKKAILASGSTGSYTDADIALDGTAGTITLPYGSSSTAGATLELAVGGTITATGTGSVVLYAAATKTVDLKGGTFTASATNSKSLTLKPDSAAMTNLKGATLLAADTLTLSDSALINISAGATFEVTFATLDISVTTTAAGGGIGFEAATSATFSLDADSTHYAILKSSGVGDITVTSPESAAPAGLTFTVASSVVKGGNATAAGVFTTITSDNSGSTSATIAPAGAAAKVLNGESTVSGA